MYCIKYLSILFLFTSINNIAHTMECIDDNSMPAAQPVVNQIKEAQNANQNCSSHKIAQFKSQINELYNKEYKICNPDKYQESKIKQFNNSLDNLNSNVKKIYDSKGYFYNGSSDIYNDISLFNDYSNKRIKQYNEICENFNKYLVSVSDSLNKFNINDISLKEKLNTLIDIMPLNEKINTLININNDNIEQLQEYESSHKKYLSDNVNIIINSVDAIRNAIKNIQRNYNGKEIYENDEKIRTTINYIDDEIKKLTEK